ncbi:PTS sugar transporter subunit IIA [Enorma massiliensis]|uniref:PTS sugar transporter subunit IIA n=1 Tax=Enorma massiliensis TaxID=1472761 RepID=UPI0002FC05CC|nr:PTS sugar transporter subunit IIA [Enorma massiliensis]
MNQLILASHGGLAEGARDTLSMVLGDVQNVHVVSLKRDDKDPITKEVEALIDSFDPADTVYVCTDMLGSSVNNSMVELMGKRSDITVISGMNMPLVLSLVTATEPVQGAELAKLIRDARRGLRNCAAACATAPRPKRSRLVPLPPSAPM